MNALIREFAIRRPSYGFTVLLALLLILVSAITFASGATERVSQQSNKLVEMLTFAHKMAKSSRVSVSICTSNDKNTCTNSAWSEGWISFVDSNATGVREQGDRLLTALKYPKSKQLVIKNSHGNRVQFIGDGSIYFGTDQKKPSLDTSWLSEKVVRAVSPIGKAEARRRGRSGGSSGSGSGGPGSGGSGSGRSGDSGDSGSGGSSSGDSGSGGSDSGNSDTGGSDDSDDGSSDDTDSTDTTDDTTSTDEEDGSDGGDDDDGGSVIGDSSEVDASTSSDMTFTVCDGSGATSTGRSITVLSSGQVSITTTTCSSN